MKRGGGIQSRVGRWTDVKAGLSRFRPDVNALIFACADIENINEKR